MDQQQNGGWSVVESATPEVQNICNKVKTQVEAFIPEVAFDHFTAVSFAHQTGKRMNFVIKVDVETSVSVHVMVSAALPGYPEDLKVLRIQYPKSSSDPLQPF
ncbi:cystatin-B-like [Xyrauchen texanus]|uniref:cystatin-B-like n=1 Tax=Xyrauchen texanus TaxID=154827 RepID=UPI00224207BE|nr:cystatin-B-like [Xyrauchen texanus]